MKLYDKYEALSPIYAGGLTSHLPMILAILKKWKIEEGKIETYLDKYVEERGIYDLTNHTLPITSFEQDYIHLTSYYINEINKKNIKEVVSEFLTSNKLSFSSALFHGIIRLYYSLETEDELQVAQALAYFNLVSEGYLLSGTLIRMKDVRGHLEKQQLMYEKLNISLQESTPIERFYELLQNEEIRDHLAYLESDDFDKEKLLDILLEKYIETEDIYIAHLISGFHALIRLNPYNYQYHETMRQFFMTMQIMFLLVKNSKSDKPNKPYTITELYEKRTILKDPHDMKLFYSVYDLSMDYKNTKIQTVLTLIVNRNEN